MYIHVEEALEYCVDAFLAAGCSREDAEIISQIIIAANLDGVDSHGISRIPIYITRMLEGRINPQPAIYIEKKGSVYSIDGDNGIGHIVTYKAIQEGVKHLKDHGIICLAIRRSNHFGQAGYYCKMIAAENAFGMVTTNSPKGIPPWGGKKAYFGTNPIAFGFPYKDEPVIIDMSSSIVARGKIILAAKNNEDIPEGWAIDDQGRPTSNAQEALKGAVLPFGGAKGYALALSLELLAGVLTGAAFGSHVQSIYEDHEKDANVGHFIILSDVSYYMDYSLYHQRMSQIINEIKSIPLAEGYEEILIPGERKRLIAAKRLKEGLPISEEVYKELFDLSVKLKIKFLRG